MTVATWIEVVVGGRLWAWLLVELIRPYGFLDRALFVGPRSPEAAK